MHTIKPSDQKSVEVRVSLSESRLTTCHPPRVLTTAQHSPIPQGLQLSHPNPPPPPGIRHSGQHWYFLSKGGGFELWERAPCFRLCFVQASLSLRIAPSRPTRAYWNPTSSLAMGWLVAPKRYVYLECQKETLAGTRVFADLIKVRILRRDHPGLRRALNPTSVSL